MPTNAIQLVLAIVLMGSGGVIGYGIGHGIGYLEGRRAGAAAEAASLNAQGENLARDAEAARAPADAPGSLQRLRVRWCRDC